MTAPARGKLDDRVHGSYSGRGVTGRAILISLLLLLLLAPVSFYVEQVVKVSWGFSGMVPPIAAVGMLFLLVAANHALAPRGANLSRRELLVIYVILTVGAPLVSRGVTLWFLACSLGQQYYVRTAPVWETSYLPYVPDWFHPGDPRAVEGFFQGDAPVLWASWWTPLSAWGCFFVALFVANLCVMLLLRRQWVTHERLSFPIAAVPLATVRERPDGSGRLPTALMFWLGFATVLLLHVQYRLPEIYPWLPSIPLGEYRLITSEKVGPLTGVGDIWLILYPWCIGLAYLIPKDLSFSVWFFWLVRVACTVIAIAAGETPRKPEEWYGAAFPAPYYQGAGAVIALAVLALWASRRQVAHAFRAVITGERDQGPERSLAYRWIVLGLVLSVGYLVFFCAIAGCRLAVALPLVALILAYHMVWARLRAENGMSFIGFPLPLNDIMLRPLGTAIYRPAEIVTITATKWTYEPGWGESCEVITGSSLDALKISESARIPQRPLVLAMIGCFIFALALGVFVELTGVHHYGFYSILPVEGWLEQSVRNAGPQMHEAMTNPTHLSLPEVFALGAGMTITFLLAELRIRFWWWPLHPVGYLAANVWGSQWWCMPLFIGWVLKSLTIRYGGLRLYQRTVPLAIGVIVGDRLSEVLGALALWLVRVHQ
ncbi:MAG: DUF6785 family protein [Planctomycetota bacterium]